MIEFIQIRVSLRGVILVCEKYFKLLPDRVSLLSTSVRMTDGVRAGLVILWRCIATPNRDAVLEQNLISERTAIGPLAK